MKMVQNENLMPDRCAKENSFIPLFDRRVLKRELGVVQPSEKKLEHYVCKNV